MDKEEEIKLIPSFLWDYRSMINRKEENMENLSSYHYFLVSDVCPLCKFTLEKKSEIIYEKRECRACNLGVFSSNCSCAYRPSGTIMVITCKNCNSCKSCDQQMFYNSVTEKTECNNCINVAGQIKEKEKVIDQKKLFLGKWKTSSPSEKLLFYGKPKLLVLARNKKIKDRSKMTKYELINALSHLVTDSDFPIR